jgi:hypothetical protein
MLQFGRRDRVRCGQRARVNASGAQRTGKPTIILVHGGWAADLSGWKSEVAAPERRGYPLVAPASPPRGLASDAA